MLSAAFALVALTAAQDSSPPAPDTIVLRAMHRPETAQRFYLSILENTEIFVYQELLGTPVGKRLVDMEHSYTEERVDTLLEVKEQVPDRVRRNWVRSSASTRTTVDTEKGRKTIGEAKVTSPLAGHTGIIEIKSSRSVGRLEDAPRPKDPELLRGHALTSGLERLLPAEAVAPGAEWEFGRDAAMAALQVAATRKCVPNPFLEDDPGDNDWMPWLGDCFDDELAWTGKATLEEASRQVDGAECAVIALRVTAAVNEKTKAKRDQSGYDKALAAKVGAELKGKLVWNRAEGRPVSLVLSGVIARNFEQASKRNSSSVERKSGLLQKTEYSCKIDIKSVPPQLEKPK